MAEFSPGTDVISGACTAQAAGATIDLNPGTYRQTVDCIPKDNQLIRQKPATVGTVLMKGSKDISALTWTASGSGWWASVTGLTRRDNGVPGSTGVPAVDSLGNNESHEVFYDGNVLTWVSSTGAVTAGEYFIDFGQSPPRVWIGNNPSGHVVELSWAGHAFFRNAGITGVTIEDLEITQYASNAGSSGGTVETKANGSDWTLRRLNVHHNHGRGCSLGQGDKVYGCKFNDNGQTGMGGSPNDGEIGMDLTTETPTECSRNNRLGFLVGWEAGGAKFGATVNLHVWGSIFDFNDGQGLWGDESCRFWLVEDNRAWDNSHGGMFYEISYDGIFRRNDCRRNGYSPDTNTGVGNASDIHIAHSGSSDLAYSVPQTWLDIWGTTIPGANGNGRGVKVYYNLVETLNVTRGGNDTAINAGHGNGIALTQQNRDNPQVFGPHYLKDVHVVGNRQVIRGNANTGVWWNGSGVHDPYTAAANNVFEGNTYETNTAISNFRWLSLYRSWSYWQTTAGMDAGMTAVTPESNLGWPVKIFRNSKWEQVIPMRRSVGAWSEIARWRTRDGAAGAWKPTP